MNLWVLLVVCVALSGEPPTSAPAPVDSSNEYYQLLALKKDTETRMPLSERKEKAKAVSRRFFETAEKLEYLSFDVSTDYYWSLHDTPRSRGPLLGWNHEEGATVHVASTRNCVATQILVKGKIIHEYYLNDGKVQEFMHPHNGLRGKTTTYPLDTPVFRLREGIKDHLLLCSHPMFLEVCGKPAQSGVIAYRDAIANRSEWVGRMKNAEGELLDVISSSADPNEKDGQWHYYFIDEAGLFRTQLVVNHEEGYKDYDRMLWYKHRTNLSTDKIPPATFSPPPELLEKAKDWKVLTEKESLAMRNK